MSHLKNYRGATNYFIPSSDKYRDNYDRIFRGKVDETPEVPVCDHKWKCTTIDGVAASSVDRTDGICNKCGEVVDGMKVKCLHCFDTKQIKFHDKSGGYGYRACPACGGT